MKRIKTLFIITLIVTMCTGCTVEYNINITKDSIEEVINVTDNVTANRSKQNILNHYNMWYPTFVNYIPEGETIEIEDFSEKVNGIEYHQKTIKELNNGYNYTYKYTYSLDEYYDSYVLASTFYETTIHEGSNNLVIKSNKGHLLCQYNYFESAKINITIDPNVYKLNYTNTSNINNNTYTWTLNKNNCDDSEIILTLNKIETNNNELNNQTNNNNNSNNNNDNKNSSYIMYIFFGVLALIIFLVYKWFNKIKEKNNNFEDD